MSESDYGRTTELTAQIGLLLNYIDCYIIVVASMNLVVKVRYAPSSAKSHPNTIYIILNITVSEFENQIIN